MTVSNIRPRVVFELFEKEIGTEQEFKVFFPPTSIGSLLLLESAILSSLAKAIRADCIFEIGTFLGSTACVLAKNTDPSTKIYSLDLPVDEVSSPQENLDITIGDQNDEFLRNLQKDAGTPYLEKLSEEDAQKISLIKCDSLKFDPDEYGLTQKCDMVFIDGGHSREIIRSDTQLAKKMLKPNGLILWHDYKSKIHTDVTDFIEEEMSYASIFHVENTMLALLGIGDYESIF